MSQLLARIEEQLATTSEPWKRAVLVARRGCYWSRVGRFDEARRTVLELRASFGQGQDGRVTVWIMLLEGLIHLYESIGSGARDRFNRAQFLSIATQDSELISITSAWKAHFEFETSDFVAMVASLQLALEHLTADRHDACSRVAMVIADVLFVCGDRSTAQTWFMLSRDHALAAGDQATIDALLYNRAAFGLAWLRAHRCFGPLDQGLVSAVSMEISSAINFQALTRVEALQNFVYLCEARVLALANDFQGASAALERIRNQGPFASYNFSQEVIDLELAYCHLRMGHIQSALSYYKKVNNSTFQQLDTDEQLVAQWMRYELAHNDPRFGDPGKEFALLIGLRAAYNESIEILRRSVNVVAIVPSHIKLH